MRKRAFLMLGLAMLLAVTAVYMARSWLEEQIKPVIVQENIQATPTKTIVVARSMLHFGNRIAPEHVTEIPWVAANLPTGAFETTKQMFADSPERIILGEIAANEPILASKITGKGGRATLSAIIDKKMRAVTIRVNDVLGVAGFVMPGDRVDILLTREEVKKQPTTSVLLQNVKVLGVDQTSNQKDDKPKVARAVTLEVTPRQGQKLTLASKVGTLGLSLRHLTNVSPTSSRPVTIRDLKYGETISVKKSKAAPKSKTVRRKRTVKLTLRKPVSRLTSVKVVRGMQGANYDVDKELPGPPIPRVTSGWGQALPSQGVMSKFNKEAVPPVSKDGAASKIVRDSSDNREPLSLLSPAKPADDRAAGQGQPTGSSNSTVKPISLLPRYGG
jgi:pilus assembly protein CpaB